MIQVNELRVGNYFMSPLTSHPIKSRGIDIICIEKDDERFLPIELTEEWLLKCGAKHSDTVTTSKNYYLIIGNAYLVFDKDSTLFNGQPINHIKYVHQLQNLYFALSGKELNINIL